jgi:hypothetical protein
MDLIAEIAGVLEVRLISEKATGEVWPCVLVDLESVGGSFVRVLFQFSETSFGPCRNRAGAELLRLPDD